MNGDIEFQQWINDTIKAAEDKLGMSKKQIRWNIVWVLQCLLLEELISSDS